jgi:hypothetical protein
MTREGLVKCREQFKPLFAERLKPISLVDVLPQTEQWLNWSRLFLPMFVSTVIVLIAISLT